MAILVGAGCVTVRERVVDESPPPAPAPRAQTPPPPPVVESVSVWDNELAPYGMWVVSGRYGRVWVPSVGVVGSGWRPYTYGHWALTEYGWTWVDDYEWAYAVHHYGRWAWDPAYGWVWLPDTVWGPAWVVWRTGDAYVGWAPLPPGVVVGTEVYVSDGSWIFVQTRYMSHPGLYRHVVWGPTYRTCMTTTYVYRDVRYVDSYRYDYGPSPRFVSSHGGRATHTRIADLDERRPVFRPRVGGGSRGGGSTAGHGPSVVSGGSGAGERNGARESSGSHGPSQVGSGGSQGHGEDRVSGGSQGHGDDRVSSGDGHGDASVGEAAAPSFPERRAGDEPVRGTPVGGGSKEAQRGQRPVDSPLPPSAPPAPSTDFNPLPPADDSRPAPERAQPEGETYEPSRSFRWTPAPSTPPARAPARRDDAAPSNDGFQQPARSKPEPQPAPSRSPGFSQPAPSQPAPSRPAPSRSPGWSKPAPSQPAPSRPAPSHPAPSRPAPAMPAPSRPAPQPSPAPAPSVAPKKKQKPTPAPAPSAPAKKKAAPKKK